VCEGCGQRFIEVSPCGEPRRVQVTDFAFKDMRVVVSEYRMHRVLCERCGEVSCASVPEAIAALCGRGAVHIFGPKVHAVMAYFSGVCRMSRSRIVSLMKELFGIRIALGTVSQAEGRMAQALSLPEQEALRYLKEHAPSVHIDETGWIEHVGGCALLAPGETELTDDAIFGEPSESAHPWLWTLASPELAVFRILQRRTQLCAKILLDDFTGITVSDRAGCYAFIKASLHQVCWAHLIRDFKALGQWAQGKKISRGLLRLSKKLFILISRVRDGTLYSFEFTRAIEPIQNKIRTLLEQGKTQSACEPTARKCASLLRAQDSFFTFAAYLDIEQGLLVEPTNNCAERSLRHGVIWRKISHGTKSNRGSRFAERMMSVVYSCNAQAKNTFQFLLHAMGAWISGLTPPSLIPQHA